MATEPPTDRTDAANDSDAETETVTTAAAQDAEATAAPPNDPDDPDGNDQSGGPPDDEDDEWEWEVDAAEQLDEDSTPLGSVVQQDGEPRFTLLELLRENDLLFPNRRHGWYGNRESGLVLVSRDSDPAGNITNDEEDEYDHKLNGTWGFLGETSPQENNSVRIPWRARDPADPDNNPTFIKEDQVYVIVVNDTVLERSGFLLVREDAWKRFDGKDLNWYVDDEDGENGEDD